MQAAAQSALSLNNHDLKGRRIAIVTAQKRDVSTLRKQAGRPPTTGLGRRADAQARTILVSGLPSGTPEFAIQQLFEKHGPVRAVTQPDDGDAAGTASVEFENAADVGRLALLPPGSVKLGEATLVIAADGAAPSKPNEADGAATATTDKPAGFAPRSTARGRGRGRAGFSKTRPGLGSTRPPQSAEPAPAPVASSSKPGALQQDAFRAMLKK